MRPEILIILLFFDYCKPTAFEMDWIFIYFHSYFILFWFKNPDGKYFFDFWPWKIACERIFPFFFYLDSHEPISINFFKIYSIYYRDKFSHSHFVFSLWVKYTHCLPYQKSIFDLIFVYSAMESSSAVFIVFTVLQ